MAKQAKPPRGRVAWLVAAVCAACCAAASAAPRFELDSSVGRDIDSHGDAVSRIVDAATREHAGDTYTAVAELCDRFGHRLLGSAGLAQATDYLVAQLMASGLQNVHTEETEVAPVWVRGNESATLLSPLLAGRQHDLSVLALGRSVGTPEGGISAPVVVVRDWEELESLGARGRVAQQIVLLNPQWRGYGDTVAYRVQGAARAAAHGAAAVLVRSVAPFSLHNAHTGLGSDDGGSTPIPAAAIATEDADLLARMASRGWDVRVNLQLGCEEQPPAPARVVIAELPGTDLAHQVVLLSGHLDSWDVGFGALDDGAGMALSWRALALLSRLGLRPRRTLRFAAWAGEEFGLGSASYWKAHAAEADNITLAAESDSGVFSPAALQLSAPVAAHAVARRVGRLLQRAGGVGEVRPGGEGADVAPAAALGVPIASLATRATAWFNDAAARNATAHPGMRFQGDYFFFHHSHADTPSLLDSAQLDASLATWAAFAFVLANISAPLPRGAPASAAALAAELGERNALSPPPVCAADWQPDEGGGDGGVTGLSSAEVALLALTAAALGAGATWLVLVPFGAGAREVETQHRGGAQRSSPGAQRAVPAAPYQRLSDVEEEAEVAGTAPRARQGITGLA